jgi:predicted ArsR family transcriptional regulator
VEDEIAAVGALGDPLRRKAYDFVVGSGRSVGRDEVARELDIGRTLAAFHLDKLVEAGLLEVTYARLTGRPPGPGAGRPAKLYRRSQSQVSVSLPPRSYVEVGALLAEAVERCGADLTLQKVAHERGRATAGQDMWEVLRGWGYEPYARDTEICLRNCPFHALAQDFPPLICGMNLALLTGLAEGADWPVRPRMNPAKGQCCVTLEER